MFQSARRMSGETDPEMMSVTGVAGLEGVLLERDIFTLRQ